MRWVQLLSVVSLSAVVASCSSSPGDYERAPFPDGRVPSASYSAVARQFVRDLEQGRDGEVLAHLTASDHLAQMKRFLRALGGHSTTLVTLYPGNDNMGEERVHVRCDRGVVRTAELTWGWLDGAWRAWPAGRPTATGDVVSTAGCAARQ